MPTCIISSLFPIQVRASDDALKFFVVVVVLFIYLFYIRW